MTETKKIIGKVDVPHERFFTLAHYSNIRGHKCEFCKKWVESRKQNFCSAKVMNLWNSLDKMAITVDRISGYKSYLRNMGC